MSEHPLQPQEEARRSHDLRRIAGGVLASVALMNAGPAMAQETYTPPTKGAEAPVEHAEGLSSVESLPGKNIKISTRAQQHLSNATVKIVRRAKLTQAEKDQGKTPFPWEDNCTGVKITDGDKTYISTALHCFGNDTGSQRGHIYASSYPRQPKALDFINSGWNEYAIQDPHVDPKARQTIGRVTGIAASTNGYDAALLKIKSVSFGTKAPRSFNQLPSLSDQKDKLRPTPGQEVGLYGVPQASGSKPVKGKGTYVGRAYGSDGILVDIVGISAEQPNQDTCNFGASGSSFISEVDGKEIVSGALSWRSNRTFDSGKYGKQVANWEALSTSLASDIRKYGDKDSNGVDLTSSDFTTLCGYTVLPDRALNQMEDGFGRYPTYFDKEGNETSNLSQK